MKVKLSALADRLRGSLWFLPAVAVAGVIVLAAGTLAIDHSERDTISWLGFGGAPETARTILSEIVTAIITLTALVFSITVVALQLASSQYSPRVLRSFLRDRPSQVTLATFLATFAYTMVVLRAVRNATASRDAFVPELSVNVAFALTAVSVGLFVYYVHHTAQSMQASTIIARVAAETVDAIDRLYPDVGDDAVPSAPEEDGERAGEATVPAPRSGYLQTVDEETLLAVATEHDLVVRLRPRVGDFVAKGAVLLHVRGEVDEDTAHRLVAALTVGRERTSTQDAAFGFRQLVDVAERALSPGVNDPSTAVQALDRLYELLMTLAPRRIPSPERRDRSGTLRAVLPRPSWDSYVHLGFDEIRHHGEGSVQVSRRIAAIVDDLVDVVPAARRGPLLDQRRLNQRATRRGFDDREDVAHAAQPSRHG
ncbi:MAG TPA: DUF2254 domain-containing protein [Acidimicrobiales bacterium]